MNYTWRLHPRLVFRLNLSLTLSLHLNLFTMYYNYFCIMYYFSSFSAEKLGEHIFIMFGAILHRHFCNVPWSGGGNFGWYLKSLYSHTMSNTKYGMLNNTNLQCYISHLFCIRLWPLSDPFIYPPLLVTWPQ